MIIDGSIDLLPIYGLLFLSLIHSMFLPMGSHIDAETYPKFPTKSICRPSTLKQTTVIGMPQQYDDSVTHGR